MTSREGQPVTDPAEEKAVVEIAERVTPEVKAAATQAILDEGPVEVSEVLRDRRDETLALVKRLLASAGIKGAFSLPEEENPGEIQVELGDATDEISPEVLQSCLKRLEADFERGIVIVDDERSIDDYEAALKQDKTAGSTWETIQERLLVNDNSLLKKAAKMQGGGELIGVYPNGELLIKTRGTEPVITAFDGEGNRLTITTDTPNRKDVMRDVAEKGRFGDYWEIRQATIDAGYTLPPDLPDYEKKGVVAAVEAVTGTYFVRSENGREWRIAVLEGSDNISRKVVVRAVRFDSFRGNAPVISDRSYRRGVGRGAVCVLRG